MIFLLKLNLAVRKDKLRGTWGVVGGGIISYNIYSL